MKSTRRLVGLVVGGCAAASLVAPNPVGAATDPNLCFIVADNGALAGSGGNDRLVAFDRSDDSFTAIGPGTGTNNIEAIDLWPATDSLYAINANRLGIIDITTGVFSAIGPVFGTASGPAGDQTISDADGMAFDPFTFVIWATERNEGSADYLFQIDPDTGEIVEDAFGPGNDYVVSTPIRAGSPDIDDIAVSTVDGTIFAIANNGSAVATQILVTLDPDTGDQTEVGPLDEPDMEGLTFDPFGELFGTDGTNEEFFDIDQDSGAASNPRPITIGDDYESVSCLTGDVNTISGSVFNDQNGDGAFDGDDIGDPGATVRLFRDTNGNGVVDDGEPEIAQRVTDANGDYAFDVAAVGDFVVQVDESTLPPGANTTTPTEEAVSFPALGLDETDVDFGSQTPATVGDFVWLDLDGDGEQDPGEPGIGNVAVEVRDADGDVVDSGFTGPDGGYSFDVAAGFDYTVSVTAPDGAVFTAQDATGDTLDSDVDASGVTASFTAAPGDNPQVGDAGILPASVGDFVFDDADADGLQGPGEAGIDGVVVRLLDATGATVIETTTAGGGRYSFDGLVPGDSYSIEVVPPDGTGFSPQDAGDDALDSDVDATGTTATFVAQSGTDDDVGDAGIITDPVTATIGDFVFIDQDGDGVQDDGEPGLSDITVELLDDAGAVIATTTTDASGRYAFPGLTPGETYRVRVTAPDGAEFTTQGAGSDSAADSDVDAAGLSAPIVPVAGSNLDVGDAGILPSDNVTVGDFVWLDLDADGVQDAGEPGIPGIPVALLDATGAVIAEATTDASGGYTFDGLEAGRTYIVRVDAPAGAEFTSTDAGTDDTVDSDVGSDGRTAPFTPVSGANPQVGDAGIIPATLTGVVFSDIDRDGDQDSDEAGIAGVPVRLIGPDGSVVATTETDADGIYRFEGIVPGPGYRVSIGEPGTSFSPSNGDVSDVGPDGNVTIVLASGDNVGDSDAGITPGGDPDPVTPDPQNPDPPSPDPAPELPATGSSSAAALRLALAFAVVGMSLVFVARRRRLTVEIR